MFSNSMKTLRPQLQPGDMIYYHSSYATAILLQRKGKLWQYSLRSPKRSNLSYMLVSLQSAETRKFEEGIASGKFKYFPVNKKG